LSDVVTTAQVRVPILKATAEVRREKVNMEDALAKLGKYTKTGGFDPTRTFQHVANFDTSVWTLDYFESQGIECDYRGKIILN
jgi:hypothetical protein